MKIIRYRDAAGNTHYGRQAADGSATRIDGDIFAQHHDTGEKADVAKLLTPIAPVDVMCIGLNYRRHAEEGNQAIPEWPVLFMKNCGAVNHPGDPILIPRQLRSDAVDYECELAVVIGKACKNVSKADALKYVLGYTCANDVSGSRLADQAWRRAVVPRQNVRDVLPAGTVSRHRRRNSRSEHAEHQDDP